LIKYGVAPDEEIKSGIGVQAVLTRAAQALRRFFIAAAPLAYLKGGRRMLRMPDFHKPALQGALPVQAGEKRMPRQPKEKRKGSAE